jgi:hypothetical protein
MDSLKEHEFDLVPHLECGVGSNESPRSLLSAKWLIRPWRTRCLFIQGLTIPDASAHELWPLRNGGHGVCFFRKEAPEIGMVPTQFVTGAVAMSANACAKFDNLRDKLLTRHSLQVCIHGLSSHGNV